MVDAWNRNFLLVFVIIGIAFRDAESFSVAIYYRPPTRLLNPTRPYNAWISTLSSAAKQPTKRNGANNSRIFSSSEDLYGTQEQPTGDGSDRARLEKRLSVFTMFTPLWTMVAASLAVWEAPWCSSVIGSLPVMQKAYATLMFVMGLAITPKDLKRALSNPSVLTTNALLCFGLMPLLASGIAKGLSYSSSQTIGMVLLGSVSGGQASNLFTLIAGGDVALSVVCTISTTLLGVFATPFLVRFLLGCAVDVNGRGVLESIASLVLVPLLTGSTLARIFPEWIRRVSPFLPTIGVLSTLLLVAGGSSNSVVTVYNLAAKASTSTPAAAHWLSTVLPSCLLACLGGALAAFFTGALGVGERTKRTLVVETLSKSPTLAYILALKHFDLSVAPVPGAAMVTLAVVGALVASIWSTSSSGIVDEPSANS